ncbi:hypothetical protein BOTBODRAFT_625295 [Botryobasidium botryosum FD-172 SS1]|uniref:ARID domain-containing protein n=1 Tax=Botryobasidium botryosum (strain FD-172 SS1) TaxID=930990 RepID=A0A067M1S7_BOTB1|nr:hypothetical protein BOTBODRAFT_625295 [Botryobasidium botryosum FD-172 SS1]
MFWTYFQNFVKQNNLNVSDIPRIGNDQIDLFKLFVEVLKLGGCEKVSATGMWPAVGAKLGYEATYIAILRRQSAGPGQQGAQQLAPRPSEAEGSVGASSLGHPVGTPEQLNAAKAFIDSAINNARGKRPFARKDVPESEREAFDALFVDTMRTVTRSRRSSLSHAACCRLIVAMPSPLLFFG